MLSDNYMEQAISAKPGKDYYIQLFLCILLAAAGILLFLFIGSPWFIGPLGLLVFIVGICLFFYCLGNHKLEYEYTLTNGSVEIAAIYNASSRKELMSFELDQVTMIVPKGSPRISTENFAKKRDYSSRTGEGQVISLVIEIDGRKELVSMEPDERLLAHIKTFARNKMYDL